jgi:hypothetical protein
MHRRNNQNWDIGGQNDVSQKVISAARCHSRYQIGGSWGDYDEVSLLG